MQLSSYKKGHGALEIMKKIFHRCFICGKLVLWDSDKIGFHMKFQHRILEREYNAKYGINLDESLEAPDKKEPLEVGKYPQMRNISKKEITVKKSVAKPVTRKKRETGKVMIALKKGNELNHQEIKNIHIEQVKSRLYRNLPYRFPLEGEESSSDDSSDSSEDSFDQTSDSSLEESKFTDIWYECELPECGQCNAA